jgi:hypothetical protein
MKKFLVLTILFILPITVYIFFASGKDNFAKLPVLTNEIQDLTSFRTADGDSVKFKDQITVLGFYGNTLLENKGNAFNLAHKIYKKNRGFKDFQLVIVLPDGMQEDAKDLMSEISQIADTEQWKFVFGSSDAVKSIFTSLDTNYSLDANLATSYVFIIDKDGNLRGRDDDDDKGLLYGFDTRDIAEINNKMHDDIKIVLAEYRLKLKKYKANRQI